MSNAPISRLADSRLGKMRITRSRRRISSFKRARAGCAETPAVLFRQKRDRRRIFKTGFQDCHGFRRFRFVCLQNLIQEQPRRIQIQCVENGPYPAMYFILHSFRRGIQNIAQEVCLTPLPGDALEGFTDGPDQPAVVIRHNPLDASKPAAFQPAKKFTPTGFRFAVAKHEPPTLRYPSGVDPDPDESASRPYAAVFAHFENQRIDKDKRVWVVMKRAVVPIRHNRIETLTQFGHRGIRKLRTE